MKVIVDTCIWSLVFKGKDPRNRRVCSELETLIDENRVIIVGPVRQEILSAYRNENQFKAVEQHLSYFPNEVILDKDYITAARFHNLCRGKGIQGSHIDFLICAVSFRTKTAIFTFDKDFPRYQKHLPIELHQLQ